jgi:hypothetical protein
MKILQAISLLVAYVFMASIASFYFRPAHILLPGFLFFLAFSFLPCLVSWLVAVASIRFSALGHAYGLLLSLLLVFLLWAAQLKLVIAYALSQSDRQVEGLLSNFVVLSSAIFSSFFVACASLLVAFTLVSLARRPAPRSA